MKKIFITILLLVISSISIYALSTNFTIDTSSLSFSINGKKEDVLENFNKDYKLKSTIDSGDFPLKKQIEELTKKTTYLLLGNFNNAEESSEEFYKRYKDYLNMRYAPEIPKDENSLIGLDQNSQEYADDLVSGMSVPGMFNILNEYKINYNSYGNIRVLDLDDYILSIMYLPNISLRIQSDEDPMEYVNSNTNLMIYYFFKELKGEYKLYYLMAETTDELNDYFIDVEGSENNTTMQVAPIVDSSLSDIYDYSKLDALSNSKIMEIYNKNSKNIVLLNSYYNNNLVVNAHGFFINDGLIVTTWSYLEKSLKNAQYFTIKDNFGTYYEIDGIVTANPETDVVVIKLKNKVSNKVIIGNSNNLMIEDPVISVSSKTGVGLTAQKGIVFSSDGYIGSDIPLIESDEGSPLFNSNGEVIGMNTSQQVNTSVSLAITSNVLKEIQDKFINIDFNDIETISFDSLKEKYYYEKIDDEIIKNNIPLRKWKKYSKIGNIEDTISLELIKASYKDNIVSLRYRNNMIDYIDTMKFSSAFREQLVNDGFEEKLVSSSKYIYQNKDYQIIIMSEFDYLIVVMVKL